MYPDNTEHFQPDDGIDYRSRFWEMVEGWEMEGLDAPEATRNCEDCLHLPVCRLLDAEMISKFGKGYQGDLIQAVRELREELGSRCASFIAEEAMRQAERGEGLTAYPGAATMRASLQYNYHYKVCH